MRLRAPPQFSVFVGGFFASLSSWLISFTCLERVFRLTRVSNLLFAKNAHVGIERRKPVLKVVPKKFALLGKRLLKPPPKFVTGRSKLFCCHPYSENTCLLGSHLNTSCYPSYRGQRSAPRQSHAKLLPETRCAFFSLPFFYYIQRFGTAASPTAKNF